MVPNIPYVKQITLFSPFEENQGYQDTVEEEPYTPPPFSFRITAKDFSFMDPGIPKDQLVDPMFLCMLV